MSKIKNDGLTRSGTGHRMLYSCIDMATVTVGVKGLGKTSSKGIMLSYCFIVGQLCTQFW